MGKVTLVLFSLAVLATGIGIGGFLFADTIARPFISFEQCKENCFKTNQLAGLLASVGIQKAGDLLPKVIMETDKTLVFDVQYPYPPDKIHYAVVSKKDIKDIAQMTQEDAAYVSDAYLVMAQIARDHGRAKYRVITNGPGYQEVAYLHFHLVIDRD